MYWEGCRERALCDSDGDGSGHFLLTELLLPKLEKSEDGGRVVNQSSAVHMYADKVDMELCDSKEHFGRWIVTYARSKLGNVSGLGGADL